MKSMNVNNDQPKFRPGPDGRFRKLTVEDVREIRYLLEQGELNNRQIGAMFGVSRVTVSQIKHGRTFAWLT